MRVLEMQPDHMSLTGQRAFRRRNAFRLPGIDRDGGAQCPGQGLVAGLRDMVAVDSVERGDVQRHTGVLRGSFIWVTTLTLTPASVHV